MSTPAATGGATTTAVADPAAVAEWVTGMCCVHVVAPAYDSMDAAFDALAAIDPMGDPAANMAAVADEYSQVGQAFHDASQALLALGDPPLADGHDLVHRLTQHLSSIGSEVVALSEDARQLDYTDTAALDDFIEFTQLRARYVDDLDKRMRAALTGSELNDTLQTDPACRPILDAAQ